MEKLLEQFKAIAPYILDGVLARLTGEEKEEAALAIIHEEILHYFEAHQNMAMQYLTFNEDQRRAFAEVMYDIHQVKGEKATAKLNPVYEKFVKETGKTGALEFICHPKQKVGTNTTAVISDTRPISESAKVMIAIRDASRKAEAQLRTES